MIQAEGATGDVYSAIDGVVEKLEKQVVKYKEKLSDHRKGDKKAVAPALSRCARAASSSTRNST
jgi:putative sigma-54 modulation protein